MASFDLINYSLRPNKTIQRSLVFESISLLTGHIDLGELVYIGFGSIWFTDFQTAHKDLKIKDLISIEGDDIGFAIAFADASLYPAPEAVTQDVYA